jgi:hypothetical protein
MRSTSCWCHGGRLDSALLRPMGGPSLTLATWPYPPVDDLRALHHNHAWITVSLRVQGVSVKSSSSRLTASNWPALRSSGSSRLADVTAKGQQDLPEHDHLLLGVAAPADVGLAAAAARCLRVHLQRLGWRASEPAPAATQRAILRLHQHRPRVHLPRHVVQRGEALTGRRAPLLSPTIRDVGIVADRADRERTRTGSSFAGPPLHLS